MSLYLTSGIKGYRAQQLLYDGGPFHKETSSLICSANQWTGVYIIGASVIKELNLTTVCLIFRLRNRLQI